MLGVLGGLEQEVSHIRRLLVHPERQQRHHLELHTGSIGGEDVVVARCGVGKVNAAMAATALVQLGADALLFTGVAGALRSDLNVGDIVVATDLAQHDVDLTALGRLPGELLFEPLAWDTDEDMSVRLAQSCQEVINATPGESARVVHGRVVSGDQFIASTTWSENLSVEFDAVCVEMEGAGFAQAASKLDVPFAVVRWISDGADQLAATKFPDFLERCGQFAARVVRSYVVNIDS